MIQGEKRIEYFENGSDGAILLEHPMTSIGRIQVEWKRPEMDLTELAQLRWIDGWTTKDLAKKDRRTPSTNNPQCLFKALKKHPISQILRPVFTVFSNF